MQKTPIYKSIVDYASSRNVAFSTKATAGIEAFLQFRRFELTKIWRSKDDKKHTKMIQSFRKEYKKGEGPITDTFLDYLYEHKQLTDEDMKEEWWRWAPIVVPVNRTRVRLNLLQLKEYAIAVGEPIFTWFDRCEVHGRWEEGVDCPSSRRTAKSFPQMKRYFVRGMGCIVRENIRPHRGKKKCNKKK